MRPQQASLALPLPAIPPKRYFGLGEVSELYAVKQHALRYWEQEFAKPKPVNPRGNRRSSQQEHVQVVAGRGSLFYAPG